jgi:hypothetical protein
MKHQIKKIIMHVIKERKRPVSGFQEIRDPAVDRNQTRPPSRGMIVQTHWAGEFP